MQERVEKLEDFVDQTSFFFSGDVSYDEQATKNLMAKGKTVKEMNAIFKAIGDKIDGMSEISVEGIESALKSVIAE